MRRINLWRGAALVVLGTTVSVLAFDYGQRHPETVAALGWLNPNPLAVVSRLVGSQPGEYDTAAVQCNEQTPVVAGRFSPVEESSIPIPVAVANPQPRRTQVIQLRNVNAADAATALQTMLANTTDVEVVVVAEPVTNQLIINVPADQRENVAQLLAAIDVQPQQVQIEVLIAEVECRDGKGLMDTFGDAGKVRAMSYDKFKALVADLQKQGCFQLVAEPTITTTDNQAARILVGQNFPYITGTSTTTDTTDTPVVTNTVAYRDIGIQIQVSPKICWDGTVIMRVVPEITTASPTGVQVTEGVFATVFSVQTMETTVAIKDGQTVAIGGLMQTRNVAPGWFCMPLTQKTEMVVFVTPHVLSIRK